MRDEADAPGELLKEATGRDEEGDARRLEDATTEDADEADHAGDEDGDDDVLDHGWTSV